MYQKTYDPFGAQLRRFADQLDRRQFQTISPGIGLMVKRSEPPVLNFQKQTTFASAMNHPAQAIPVAPREWTQSPVAEKRSVPMSLPSFPKISFNFGPQVSETMKQSVSGVFAVGGWLIRAVVIHALDIFTVAVALLLSLFIAGFCFAPRGDLTLVSAIMNWLPVKLVIEMKLLHFMALIYILFALYYAVFRLAIGMTIGNFFARIFLLKNQ